MRKTLLILSGSLLLSAPAMSQISRGGMPLMYNKGLVLQAPEHIEVAAPDLEKIRIEDEQTEKQGVLRRIGRQIQVNLNMQNSGTWETLDNGTRVWRLKISSPGAKGLALYYSNFHLPQNSQLFLYSEDMKHRVGAIGSENNPVGQNTSFATQPVYGENIIIEYSQSATVTDKPILEIEHLGYIYRDFDFPGDILARDFGDSESCEVNAQCSEAAAWTNQRRSAVRILVVSSSGMGWCSGALVNNTTLDCAPYILTADHCSGAPSTTSTAAQLNQWMFYFNFEGPTCADPASGGTLDDQVITGCDFLARGGNGGNAGSDFYLVELDNAIPSAYNVYYSGWNRNNTASPSGFCFHHPAGDIKKISTYTSTLISDEWGSAADSHWRVTWAATTNGHGVTEGGSSGSPIYDNTGLIVGDLTGGSSFCTATSSPDLYGKFSYSWASNTTPATNNKLQPWLDPANSTTMTLAGTNAPCIPQAPVANFVANNTAPCPNTTVTFTDQTANTPTSWAWTFSPTTITYVNSTSASSQNPQVQFTAAGTYTVTLVATNVQGSDTEVKTTYITVAAITGQALPYIENFEAVTFPPAGITLVNADAGAVAWGTDGIKGIVRRAAAGNTGSTAGSAALNCYNYNTAGTIDELHLPALDLTSASNPYMKFKRAYRPYDATYFETLKVLVSGDCGTSWATLWNKSGTTLSSNGAATTTSYTPSTANDWDKDSVSLSAYVGQTVQIKFEITNGYGNNIYIDDINVENVALNAGVTISASATTICAGQSVTFIATPTNGGTPTYQWQLNSVNIAGATSSIYTTTTLANGDQIRVVMTSSLAVGNNPATSAATTITVNAIPATPTITVNGTQLTSSSATGNQWYLNGSPISGATSQVYNAVANGNYTVVVTTNGCSSSASAITNITGIGIEELIQSTSFTVYPNPNEGMFNLNFEVLRADDYKVEVRNAIGQLIYSENLNDYSGRYNKQLNLANEGKGVYFVRLMNSKSEGVKRVVIY